GLVCFLLVFFVGCSADLGPLHSLPALRSSDLGQRHVAGIGDAVAPRDRLTTEDVQTVTRGATIDRHLVDGDLRRLAVVAAVVAGRAAARVAGAVGDGARGRAGVAVVAADGGATGLADPGLVGVQLVVAVPVTADVGRVRPGHAVGHRSSPTRRSSDLGDAVAPRDRLAAEDVQTVTRGAAIDRHLVDGDLRRLAVVAA